MMERTDFRAWMCTNCGCRVYREEYTFSLGEFEIKTSTTSFTLTPQGLEDQRQIIDELNEGGCPVCDTWEDGEGNLIIDRLNGVV